MPASSRGFRFSPDASVTFQNCSFLVTVEADLNGMTRDGLLQAYLSLMSGPVKAGDRVVVYDLFDGSDCYDATVAEVLTSEGMALLNVQWDDEGGVNHASV